MLLNPIVFMQQSVQYLQILGGSLVAWAPAECLEVLDLTPSYDSAAGEREENCKRHCLNRFLDKQNK